jgi:hypothetical protein
MTKTIEIIVSPTGETRLETKGFAGSGCLDASRLLEQALGAKAGEQLTAEFYAQVTHHQQIQGGQA